MTFPFDRPTADADALDTSYLDHTIGFALKQAQLAVSRDIHSAFGHNATTVQFSALVLIKDNPGASQKQLAFALSVEGPRMVPILNSLEERGLLVRQENPDDRRARSLFLTPAGLTEVTDLQQRFAAHESRVLAALGAKNREITLRSLRKLASLDMSED